MKLTLLGAPETGKSWLLARFSKSAYVAEVRSTYKPTIASNYVMGVNRGVKLEIYDVSGQSRYEALLPMYIKPTQCSVIMAHPEKPEDLNYAKMMIALIKQEDPNINIMLVLNTENLESGTSPMALLEEWKENNELGEYNDINTLNTQTGEGVEALKDRLFGLAQTLGVERPVVDNISSSASLEPKRAWRWPVVALSILTVGLLPLVLAIIAAVRGKNRLNYAQDIEPIYNSSQHEVKGAGLEEIQHGYTPLIHGSPAAAVPAAVSNKTSLSTEPIKAKL